MYLLVFKYNIAIAMLLYCNCCHGKPGNYVGFSLHFPCDSLVKHVLLPLNRLLYSILGFVFTKLSAVTKTRNVLVGP